MAIDPTQIKVGHCYAASADQRRRVTSIVGGHVQYEAWHDDATGSPVAGAGGDTPTLEAFARAVEREVPCPEVTRTTPSKAEG